MAHVKNKNKTVSVLDIVSDAHEWIVQGHKLVDNVFRMVLNRLKDKS